MPAYYAPLVVDSFVGSSGSSSVVEIEVDDDRVAGYAAFEDGKLARAVFVNLDPWLSSSTGARPSVHMDFSFVHSAAFGTEAGGAVGSTATAQRLIIGHADDTEGLEWAGRSYETVDALPRGKVVQERVVLREGLDLPSSQAVLVIF